MSAEKLIEDLHTGRFATWPQALDWCFRAAAALAASQEEITRLRKALDQRPVIFMDEKGNITTTDGQAVLAMFEAIGPARVGSKLLPLVPLPAHPHEGDSA